jgi:hypothetical protein
MNIIALAIAISLVTPPATGQPEPGPTFIGPVQHAYDHGWRDCAPTLDKFIRAAMKSDTEYGMFNHWSHTDPNSGMFTTVMSGGGAVMTFSAVKNGRGSCDLALTEVIPFSEPCDKIQETEFKDWKPAGKMGDVPIFMHRTAEGNSAVFSPLPSGCLVTKLVTLFGS